MHALVYTGTNKIDFREEKDPIAKPGEILIKVKASGICGSDMHAFHGNDDEIIFSSWQQSGSPPRSTTAQLHGGYPTLFTVSDDGKLAACLVEHWLESDKITWFELLTFNTTYPSKQTSIQLEMPKDFFEAYEKNRDGKRFLHIHIRIHDGKVEKKVVHDLLKSELVHDPSLKQVAVLDSFTVRSSASYESDIFSNPFQDTDFSRFGWSLSHAFKAYTISKQAAAA